MLAPRHLYAGLIVAALAAVIGIAGAGCAIAARSAVAGYEVVRDSELFHQGRHGRLTDAELQWANAAWAYYETNYHDRTGLVNGMHKFPSVTAWHIADAIAGTVAAHQIGLIDEQDFDERLSAVIAFLNVMDLAGGAVPNKTYHAQTGEMTGTGNRPAEVGWSAVDIGRLLTWLRIVATLYPASAEYVDKAVLRWNFCDVVTSEGALRGSVVGENGLRFYQEGRLGYEEYAAMGFRAWGFETPLASGLDPLEVRRIEGLDVPVDPREDRAAGIHAPLVTLPFLLMGIEYNWDTLVRPGVLDSVHTDPDYNEIATAIYAVQEARYRRQRVLTARTDHPISQAPYYVMDSIHAAGYAWNTIDDQGNSLPHHALVSTRAAFLMWTLFKTPYTDRLMDVVQPLHDDQKGWYEGRSETSGGYERTVSLSTNAIVLEALLYKMRGKLFPIDRPYRHWTYRVGLEFEQERQCLPVSPGPLEGRPDMALESSR